MLWGILKLGKIRWKKLQHACPGQLAVPRDGWSSVSSWNTMARMPPLVPRLWSLAGPQEVGCLFQEPGQALSVVSEAIALTYALLTRLITIYLKLKFSTSWIPYHFHTFLHENTNTHTKCGLSFDTGFLWTWRSYQNCTCFLFFQHLWLITFSLNKYTRIATISQSCDRSEAFWFNRQEHIYHIKCSVVASYSKCLMNCMSRIQEGTVCECRKIILCILLSELT